MVLATEAAAQLKILSQLPPDTLLTHHPSPAHQPHALQFPHPQPPPQPRDPDAMEVNALTTAAQQKALLMDATRSIFREQKLCFRCLKPIVPGTHMGSINCLNMPVTLKQRRPFVDQALQTPTTQVAHIHTKHMPPFFSSPFEDKDLRGHDKCYKCFKELEEAKAAIVSVSTSRI
ncbi:hypothetical protein PCANC_24108 [Puccinia coronata f. sp. avenae]|uniref:Uncharacterized protein n=1 Tax=Puccinia coronata f. sp. avenae TaxID=200324 RepID=A0A2N5SQX9_9BASI|nr:hypothetical protein PCANC_24108 [Puccinia coronata f. sp. avenae]